MNTIIFCVIQVWQSLRRRGIQAGLPIQNIILELYSTCISILKNFGVFFLPPPKLPNLVKFGQNFAEILNPGDRFGPVRFAEKTNRNTVPTDLL